jgi:hypothetical protein
MLVNLSGPYFLSDVCDESVAELDVAERPAAAPRAVLSFAPARG